MAILYALSALTVLIVGTLAGSPWPAGCANFQYQANFEISRYQGKWYLLAMYSTSSIPYNISCGYLDLNFNKVGIIEETQHLLFDSQTTLINATASYGYQGGASTPVWLANKPDGTGVLAYEWIFKTDYDYALTYRCLPAQDENSQDVHMAIILTKQKNPSASYINEVEQKFRDDDNHEWQQINRMNLEKCESF